MSTVLVYVGCFSVYSVALYIGMRWVYSVGKEDGYNQGYIDGFEAKRRIDEEKIRKKVQWPASGGV